MQRFSLRERFVVQSVVRDYYGLLGVRKEATADEIKKAYRKLARELHPDVNPDPAAQQKFKEVSTAYEVLSDPAKRQVVDLGGDPMSNGQGGGQGEPFGNMGFGDIMDAFFGGNGRQRGPRSRVRQGEDALVDVELTLEECATGVSKDLALETAMICSLCQGAGTAEGTTTHTCDTCKGAGEIQQVQRSFLGQVVTARPCPVCRGFGEVIPDPCRQCNGDGRVRTRRSVRVNIPAGVGDGIRVRMSGQGEVGPGGGTPGDLYVEVRELPHEMFTRDGVDLHCTVHVPMTAAALGTSMTLATLLDSEELDIRAGTQSGTVLTIKSQGMPRLRGTGNGNLFVHIEVLTPTKIDPRQAELLRELASLRGEEQPELAERSQGSIFSRIRDSLAGR